jgi:ATP-dependent protease ClpP protease subunit
VIAVLQVDMSRRQAFRLLWLGFAAAIAVLTWQFREHLDTLWSARGELTVEERPGEVVLRWRGLIEAPLAARLDEAYRAHAGGTRRFVIALHSPGGTLEHGREVIGVIRRMQRTHLVDTVVEDRRACGSMCVPVYLAGQRRTAAPRARFMFHEVSFRDSLSGKIEQVPKEAIGRATDQFFERYLKPAGLDQRWLADLREAIRGRNVWRTAEELIEQRSGVVHELEPAP